MKHVINGRFIELETADDGTVDSNALREAAGIPEDRPLVVQMPDGSNKVVNSGESVRVSPGQFFFDAPSHKRGNDLDHGFTLQSLIPAQEARSRAHYA